MRKKGIYLVWLCLVSHAGATSLIFQAPTLNEPYYRISFPFEVKEGKVLIQDLLLNESKVGLFLVFQGGKNIPSSSPLERGQYNIVLDYAWASGKAYKIKLLWTQENSKKQRQLEVRGQSPQEGGIPGAEEGFYRTYRIEEPIGIERRGEICLLTVTAPRSEIETADFVLFEGRREIPYQVLEKKECIPPEKASANHPVTLTCQLAVPMDAGPKEKKVILLLRGQKRVQSEKAFLLTGEGLGKTVKNNHVQLSFHPQSGQINTIDYSAENIHLFNKAGVIHWNPDVFIPGQAWDHSFDWNPPAHFEERTGEYVYINLRRGPFPRIPDVSLEVKYTLEIDAPYFLSETRLTFGADKGVIAVRNDEMVLYKELFDSLLYPTKEGKTVQMPLREKEGLPFGLVHIAPQDAEWVGLLNTKENFGFFSLRVSALNACLEAAGEFLLRPGTYFYAPADGNYVYWVRPLIYTWADYTTNNHLTFVPQGSFFYEKNAYLVLRLGEDVPEKIQDLHRRLRNPLRVF